MSGLVKVSIRCEEVVVYRRKMEMPASAVAEYDAAVEGDFPDEWFSAFAERFIDPLTDAEGGSTFDDVELTVLKP